MENVAEDKSLITSYRLLQDEKYNLQQDLKHLRILQKQYLDILSDKEKYITKQNKELQRVRSDLTLLQKNDNNNFDELIKIRIEHNNQTGQFWKKI